MATDSVTTAAVAGAVDAADLEQAYQRALGRHFEDGRAGMRSLTATLALMVMAATFAVLPLWPLAERVLGVSVRVSAPIAAIAALAILHATLAFHRGGALGRWYRLAERMESVCTVTAAYSLILASGSPVSVFWLFFMLFIADVPNNPLDVEWAAGVFGIGAAVLGALFGASGDVASAGITLALGVFGTGTIWTLGISVRRRLRAEAERGLLRDQLSAVLVDQERDRIARDLHDGVAADLTALVWRARALREQVSDTSAAGAVDELVSDAKRSLDDLRDVVGAMNGQSQDWSAFTSELQARVAALTGGALLHEVVCRDEEGAEEVSVEVRVHVLRMVQEAVQNVARHARATTVRVELTRGRALELRIRDDGIGIPSETSRDACGGLKNISRRASSLGGELVVVPSCHERPGAELFISLPLSGAPRSSP